METFNLNKAVKRNLKRFPSDFMFQLTKKEWENLTFQNGISSSQHGGRRTLPYAFTEQGVAMLAAILNSQKAIDVNISIMRAFIKLRHFALSQTNTNDQFTELRRLLMLHIENCDTKFAEYDDTIQQIIDVLNTFIEKPPETKQIGFTAPQYKE